MNTKLWWFIPSFSSKVSLSMPEIVAASDVNHDVNHKSVGKRKKQLEGKHRQNACFFWSQNATFAGGKSFAIFCEKIDNRISTNRFSPCSLYFLWHPLSQGLKLTAKCRSLCILQNLCFSRTERPQGARRRSFNTQHELSKQESLVRKYIIPYLHSYMCAYICAQIIAYHIILAHMLVNPCEKYLTYLICSSNMSYSPAKIKLWWP